MEGGSHVGWQMAAEIPVTEQELRLSGNWGGGGCGGSTTQWPQTQGTDLTSGNAGCLWAGFLLKHPHAL